MQKAKGNRHKMSKTPEGRPSSADVKNNSEKLSVLGKLGQVAAEATGAVKGIVRTATNRNGFAKRLGINIENTGDSEKDSREGSSNGLTPEEVEALKRDARVVVISTPEEQTSDNTEDTSESSAEKNIPVSEPPEPTPDELARIKWNDEMRDATAKRSVLVHPTTEEDLRKLESFGVDIDSSSVKPSTPEKPVDVSKNEPKHYSLDDLIYEDVPESKANEILRKAYGTAHEPKTLDELINNPNISQDEVDRILDRVYGSSSEKNDRKDDVNSAKSNQESGAAESSKDKQTKDSNSGTGEVPVKEISPEEYKAATNLEIARSRFAKASVAVESHFFKKHFGGKKRQEELDAATEELKQSELEYMRFKFADKIEAAKQDPKKQAELAAEMGQAAFASMQETSRTTTDKYDNMLDDRGKFKKAAAKVGKWFNKGGKIAQWLKLGGAGFVVGTATGTFAGIAGWPITTAVGIVTKLGVAGATKQAVLEEYRGEDRIAADDRLETIDPSFKDTVANMKIDDVMERAVNVSVDNLKDVSIERRDALRKKVISSSGKYAVGFVLGGVVGSFINDWWANSAHATGPESSTDTPAQSGSEQIPQSSGASSVDNSVDKIVNNINPDTSNFNSYDYPWDWAAEKFGDANAMDQLHNLADKAIADGHTVQWFDGPGGTWMEVDGSSTTADVLKVLNKYV